MAKSQETAERTDRDFEPITDGSAEDLARVRFIHLAWLEHALSAAANEEALNNPSEDTDS
ncbi:MAG: hypothetical protein A2900_02000 [Candidatus Chisholmbacteria bacterium RIFCSPLOWO2_01_FULL_50_28]|uniref:Uncharacterized protein n=1 Tax=Candidatus Chisholmbacteria bacterium RIFCSPHIGHO2_01_FULL_52_32 TaxID=1797591 RepID=A0A1G1VTX7_9BACT|nr:MAG: hypothetical protein A2786_04745 [Candidatus Chisholmbacteria bacterium RIFCSPHIGHO2_01_FULL_52_32]OGY19856.1 MAG: hypothetical protein A2900_02000 [Candidatus Chisholmbacteria bacterium RIFCSPLOWO2_01_FULL_50_28]